MNYISEIDGVTYLDEYFEYLKSVKSELPTHVYDFASNSKYYSLTDYSSLHDAWLNSLNILEPSEGKRNEKKIEITMNLLGPFHDREITLQYLDVQSYEFQTPLEFENPPCGTIGHGDLLIHEVRLEGELIVHEIRFSRGSFFIIKCKDLIHSETIIEKDH